MNFLDTLQKAQKKGDISEKLYMIFLQLYESYSNSMRSSKIDMRDHDHIFETFLKLVQEQVAQPHIFETFHKRVTKPFDYYQFGIDFLYPLIDRPRSKVCHPENVEKIARQVGEQENVILLANHQTEVDPCLLSIALEKTHPQLGEEVIFVAGHRVVTDPMAIPFSLGRNLLCIYSKRHIDNPPEKKLEKQQHNQRTMRRMRELLEEGGKLIYVAPSGGRDRLNSSGEVEVAPFDPQAIEMFRLMAKQSKKPAHFYPLALATFDILPPPQTVESEVGEERRTKREGVRFSFGDEIDMDHFPGAEITDRHAKRSARAEHIWNLVKSEYTLLKQES